MSRRITIEWNWWAINRPHLLICDPDLDEGTIWIGFHWGNGNSDPVLLVDVKLSGLPARPLIARANRRWDREVARRQAETTP